MSFEFSRQKRPKSTKTLIGIQALINDNGLTAFQWECRNGRKDVVNFSNHISKDDLEICGDENC